MFRQVLMAPSSKSIWISARANVFLPDLEATDFSEAQYASLIFERNCHICGKNRASKVDYYLRVRWCQPCQKKNLLNMSRTRRSVDYPLQTETFSSSPYTLTSSTRYFTNNEYYLQRQVILIDDRIKELKALVNATSSIIERAEQSENLKDYIARRKQLREQMRRVRELRSSLLTNNFLTTFFLFCFARMVL